MRHIIPGRGIPFVGVAHRSLMPNKLALRALPAGRRAPGLMPRPRFKPLSRRELIGCAAAAVGLGTARTPALHAQTGRFSIGACAWSLGMRAKTEALAVAKQLGLDGVQVSMGSVDNDLQLRRPDLRRGYRETAAANGVRIGGVALDIMNQVPYKSDPRTEQWVGDSIDA